MPGSIGMGAQGWRAQVYHPWRCTLELDLSRGWLVEAPGHPAHPPPLATQWWEIKGLKFMPNFRVLMIFSSREKSRVVFDAIPIMQEMRCDW